MDTPISLSAGRLSFQISSGGCCLLVTCNDQYIKICREFERSCDETTEILGLRSGASKLRESESGSNVEESESDTEAGKREIKAE